MKIICGAYSTDQLPPLKIEKLHPNVLVQITNGRPRTTLDSDLRKELNELHQAWLKKTGDKLSISCRKRIRGEHAEVSASSPTGERNFHVASRSARLNIR